MGYAGKLEEKRKARNLRKQGLSYKEIQRKVKVSKSTLSRWCRDIILSVEQMERLRKKKIVGALKGRIKGAKKQQTMRIKKTKKLIKEGIKEVGKLDKRDRFIAGLGLYLGDGLKGDRCVGFSNSNPKLIKFMVDWFREFLEVSDGRFRGQLWIHENLDKEKAEKYWANLTGIAINNFHKTYIAKNKKESKKIRKKRHEYGVFSIKISCADAQRKLKGWMSGIVEDNRGR